MLRFKYHHPAGCIAHTGHSTSTRSRSQVNFKKTLKQLGLAFRNYHETHRCLPPGGTIRDDDNVAMHGWLIMLLPFCEASPTFNMVDFHVPWDHTKNQEHFEQARRRWMIPGVDANYTNTGFALTHYLGNPNLLHRNSSVTFEQMENGTEHTWVVGEVAGNFQPWGYPFNWRPLGSKLCDGPDSFGCPPCHGGHLLFADGSVLFFSDETAPKILEMFAAMQPHATKEQTAVPNKKFVTSGFEKKKILKIKK